MIEFFYMKNSRQLIIGIIIGVLATIAVGASLPTQVGRYQVSTAAGQSSFAIILDTATGECWYFNREQHPTAPLPDFKNAKQP
jgi:hypothetical protein